mmetsp:Transcript_1833/g.5520  ORF Transcript_1833/g.5520 Transcript_1833/m.5520 type:complete len:223 (-) Transcript_1833:207-875(-)
MEGAPHVEGGMDREEARVGGRGRGDGEERPPLRLLRERARVEGREPPDGVVDRVPARAVVHEGEGKQRARDHDLQRHLGDGGARDGHPRAEADGHREAHNAKEEVAARREPLQLEVAPEEGAEAVRVVEVARQPADRDGADDDGLELAREAADHEYGVEPLDDGLARRVRARDGHGKGRARRGAREERRRHAVGAEEARGGSRIVFELAAVVIGRVGLLREA